MRQLKMCIFIKSHHSSFILLISTLITLTSLCADAAPSHHHIKREEVTDIEPQETKPSDENWHVTQKWLIESINRLRGEINELGHNYEVHFRNKETDDMKNQQDFVHDLAVLRADHSVLANQQQKIIDLIKEWRDADTIKTTTETTVPQHPSLESHPDPVVRHHRRKHRRRIFSDFMDHEKKFESQASKNVTELFGEVSALHDITLALFHDVQDLEQRLDKKETSADDSKNED